MPEIYMSEIKIITDRISRAELRALAGQTFGDFVKAVVDIERRRMAVGGELHSDAEQILLEDGSKQEHLWGINLYPEKEGDHWIEFNSMINIRPSQGNRSRGVEDIKIQGIVRDIVREKTTEYGISA